MFLLVETVTAICGARDPEMVMNWARIIVPVVVTVLGSIWVTVPAIAQSDSPSTNATLVERGKAIAIASNCLSCHTLANNQPYSGGVLFETPFGKIYAPNITSDTETGIGKWTEEQFVTALRKGVRPDGTRLYPVFPYTSYTKMLDEDAAALYAFMQSVKAVNSTVPENELRFPYSQRWMLRLWNAMYFDEGRFEPNPAESEQWNRGAYLVEGLGHCGACHTPRNGRGAEIQKLAMTGATYKERIDGQLLDWSATNLTQAHSGLGTWTTDDIFDYLKTGYSSRAGVFGPMNEVILNSTRLQPEADIRAMAVYLKSLPGNEQELGDSPDEQTMRRGAVLYDIHCGTCHQPDGQGSDTTGPPLVGSPVTLAPDPASLINITIYGPHLPAEPPSDKWATRKWQVMESYDHKLDDEEMAILLSYVRAAWNNNAGSVTPEQVAKQRPE